MPKATTLPPKPSDIAKPVTAAQAGRVFKISLQGIPRIDANTKARLEAAARSPASARRDYPQVNAD